MKIEHKQDQLHEGMYTSLQEIYGNTVLETAEGKQLAICMRDDTIEMSVVGKGGWYRANMQTGEVEPLGGNSTPLRYAVWHLTYMDIDGDKQVIAVSACSELAAVLKLTTARFAKIRDIELTNKTPEQSMDRIEGFVGAPTTPTLQRFEIFKYYKHTSGTLMHIIGRVKTTVYGTTLLAEETDGSFKPVGEDEANMVNWVEITHQEWSFAFPEGGSDV